MNALVKKLAPNHEDDIATELDRLFALQDRPLTKDKRVLMVNELSASGMPFKAIMAGIRSLCDEDLKQIKFSTICEAAGKHVEHREIFDDCKICGRVGFVTLVTKDKYSFSYPCTCSKGQATALAQRLRPWNGCRTMVSPKCGAMVLVFPDPDKNEIPEISDQEYAATASGNQTEQENTWVE